MQRRRFAQLLMGGLACSLGACAAPSASPEPASTSSAPAEAPKAAAPTRETQPTKAPSNPPQAAPPEPTTAPQPAQIVKDPLPDGPIAPFIQSDTWINVAKPIEWDSLRGTVTMVEFWTYG